MKRKKLEVCIYCGLFGEVTREHVPSRNLFHSGVGVDFRFVYSCLRCNASFSKDEEFFRNWLLNFNYEISPEATLIFDNAVSRSYRRKPFLAQHFYNSMKLIDVVDPNTQSITQMTAISTEPKDMIRVRKIVAKFVRGLCKWHFGENLKPEFHTKAVLLKNLDWLNENKDILEKMPLNIVKKDVFEYKYGQVPGSHQSLWILRFYDSTFFTVYVAEANFFDR